MTSTLTAPPLTSDRALKVARVDAEQAYRDLSRYRTIVALHTDGWHIDYELLFVTANGGGPHYLIDANTGEIVWKRYEQ